MKRSTRSIRRYRDSQAKLIIAKRRYQDALRRYQDAEVDAQKSKVRALIDHVDEKFGMFVKDHPELVKHYQQFKQITKAILKGIALIPAGIAGGIGVVAFMDGVESIVKGGNRLEKLAKLVPKTIGAAIYTLGLMVKGLGKLLLRIAQTAKKQSSEIALR